MLSLASQACFTWIVFTCTPLYYIVLIDSPLQELTTLDLSGVFIVGEPYTYLPENSRLPPCLTTLILHDSTIFTTDDHHFLTPYVDLVAAHWRLTTLDISATLTDMNALQRLSTSLYNLQTLNMRGK